MLSDREPGVAFARSRRPAATHVVFALYLYAFVLLVGCAISPGERGVELVVGRWEDAWDAFFVIPALAAIAVDLFHAVHRSTPQPGSPGFCR